MREVRGKEPDPAPRSVRLASLVPGRQKIALDTPGGGRA
jgi:hypothetical protein